MAEAYCRQAGKGRGVVCIHGSASSSLQWRSLMDRLSNRYQFFAPDLYGYGKSPAWRARQKMSVSDEVRLLESVFESIPTGMSLIGHSWGAAVALKTALRYRQKLVSLVLFEPAQWSILIAEVPDSPASQEILRVRDHTLHFMERGNWLAAAECFLEYWVGLDIWNEMTNTRRMEVANSMHAVRHDWHASFHDPTTLSDLATIDVPVLLLTGSESPTAARTLVQMIGTSLPLAKITEMSGVGHMGPITHSDQVNQVIEEFLLEHGC